MEGLLCIIWEARTATRSWSSEKIRQRRTRKLVAAHHRGHSMKAKKDKRSDGPGRPGDQQNPVADTLGAVVQAHPAAEAAGQWLRGEGEMARRIREFDWSKTPIGPIESWPQSLRTAASLCLASRFQLIIFWTRDLIQLYNDAFLTILGNKHPQALGQPARESWAEMWDVIAPLYEHVFATGTATWTEHIHLPVASLRLPGRVVLHDVLHAHLPRRRQRGRRLQRGD